MADLNTDRWDIRVGDSLALLTQIETGTVDAVVTDCPYSSGGMTRGDRTQATSAKYVNNDSVSGQALAEFSGDTRDQRSFGYWSALWYSECLRCTKPGGALFSFTDWRQLPTTTDSVQAGGWVWRGIVPWDKTPASRPQKGRPRLQCEYVVFGTNGPHRPEADAPVVDGFFVCDEPEPHYTFCAERNRLHIAQKPIKLMEALVSLVPAGGVVLDPFAGSGTTGLAAVKLGRFPILFEIQRRNAEIIAERLAGVGITDAADTQRNLFTGGDHGI